MRSLLVSLCCASLAFGGTAAAMDRLLAMEGDPAVDITDIPTVGQQDADGDGLPEICFTTGQYAAMTLSVAELSGAMDWVYSLPKASICPSCSAYWSWDFMGFADLDPAPGTEAVLTWYDYGPPEQEGMAVVNVSSSAVVDTLLGARPRQLVDLNGDGRPELIVLYDAWPDARFEVWGYPGGSGVPPQRTSEVERGVRILERPNPSASGATLSVQVDRRIGLRVRIVDVQGRLVRDLGWDTFTPGFHDVTWDSRDAAGEPVPAGLYLVVLEGSGVKESGKVMVAR